MRASQIEGEYGHFRQHFDDALENVRCRAEAVGYSKGKRETEEDFWSGFQRQMFPEIDKNSTFPLKKRTTITVRERLSFKAFTLSWQNVVTITLTKEIASAAELSEYIQGFLKPLAPIATAVVLGAW